MLPAYQDLNQRRRALLVLAGACVAIFFAASELRDPVITLFSVNLTTSELAAGFFFLTVIIWGLGDRRDFFSPRALDLAVALFVLVNFLSAALSPDKPAALKFALRMTYAAFMYFGISRLPSKARSHIIVAAAATVTLVPVTVLGLLESFVDVDWPDALSPWHEGISTFGDFTNLRASSFLPYPTVLSMFLELVFPLSLALGLWLLSRQGGASGRKKLIAVIAAGTVSVMALQVNTFTRASLVIMPASLLLGAAAAWIFGYGRRVVFFFVLAALTLVAVVGISTFADGKSSVRLGVEEQVNQFNAEYALVDLSQVRPGGEGTAAVKFRNTSNLTWMPEGKESLDISYRWVTYPEKDFVEVPYLVTEIPGDVPPGDAFQADVAFATPENPGRYVLIMELVLKGVGWFSELGVPPLVIPLETGPGGSSRFIIPEGNEQFLQVAPEVVAPGRKILWSAAIKAWKANPVLGLGPDQFRLHYAEYEPELHQNERIESHNIFLEALANTGLVGVAAMVFLLGSASWYCLKLLGDRSIGMGARLVSLALVTALAAYVAHGLLDYFLWQTGIAFMFFTELGLISWLYRKKSAGTATG